MTSKAIYIVVALMIGGSLAAVESLLLGLDLSIFTHLGNGILCVLLVNIPPIRQVLNNAIAKRRG